MTSFDFTTTNTTEETKKNLSSLTNGEVDASNYAEENNLDVKENERYMMLYRRWNNKDNSVFQYCDGLILDKETQQVVCCGLNKMAEVSGYNKPRAIEQLKQHPFFNNVKFNDLMQYSLHDGTLIRLFYHDGEWCKSTNRTIDAYQASWDQIESFGNLFDEVACSMNFSYDKLNKDYCYMIVVQHPNNRIVQPVEQASLIHIGTFNIKENLEVSDDIGLPKHQSFNFDTLESMVGHLSEQDWTFPGFLLINSRNERLRIENPKYVAVKQLKGMVKKETQKWRVCDGVNPLMVRLVYLMRDHKDSEYIRYFPEHAHLVHQLHDDLNTLRDEIWEVYEERYILKNFSYHQEPRLYHFIRTMHSIYRESREPITLGIVEQNIKAVAPLDTLMHALKYIDYKLTKEEFQEKFSRKTN
jgi:hypothetical protein